MPRLAMLILLCEASLSLGKITLTYSVINRRCACPGESVELICVATGGLLTFNSTRFPDDITFFSFDQVPRTVVRSVGDSIFAATLNEVSEDNDLTATLTVVVSEEVTGTVSCSSVDNTQNITICLPGIPQPPQNFRMTGMEHVSDRCTIQLEWEQDPLSDVRNYFISVPSVVPDGICNQQASFDATVVCNGIIPFQLPVCLNSLKSLPSNITNITIDVTFDGNLLENTLMEMNGTSMATVNVSADYSCSQPLSSTIDIPIISLVEEPTGTNGAISENPSAMGSSTIPKFEGLGMMSALALWYLLQCY